MPSAYGPKMEERMRFMRKIVGILFGVILFVAADYAWAVGDDPQEILTRARLFFLRDSAMKTQDDADRLDQALKGVAAKDYSDPNTRTANAFRVGLRIFHELTETIPPQQ